MRLEYKTEGLRLASLSQSQVGPSETQLSAQCQVLLCSWAHTQWSSRPPAESQHKLATASPGTALTSVGGQTGDLGSMKSRRRNLPKRLSGIPVPGCPCPRSKPNEPHIQVGADVTRAAGRVAHENKEQGSASPPSSLDQLSSASVRSVWERLSAAPMKEGSRCSEAQDVASTQTCPLHAPSW